MVAIRPEEDMAHRKLAAPIRLVLYGDYTCPETARIRDILARVRDRLNEEVAYSYRQYPSPRRAPDAENAARAALAAEKQGKFWEMHDALFEVSPAFDESILESAADDIGLDINQFKNDAQSETVTKHLEEDRKAGKGDGVFITPSLFINGRLYEDVWAERAILDAIEEPLARRIRSASEAFFNWAASAGLVLIAATIAALLAVNLGAQSWYQSLVSTPLAISFGDDSFSMPLVTWANDALMAIFFLLVGIEIKREVIAGELSSLSSAALPLVGAVGGMLVPAAIYVGLNSSGGDIHGWGVPMATDIAFTLGLIAILGNRVPSSLKVFLSALAVADDMGAVLVIAIFYGHGFDFEPFVIALGVLGIMGFLNWSRIMARTPYVVLGVLLWWFVHDSGLHATLAGVLTAIMIPSRRIENVEGVAAQTSAILRAETDARQDDDPIRPQAFRLLKTAVEGLREPGFHLERALNRWTNFLILPLFAFLNTGVVLQAQGLDLLSPQSLGVTIGLVIGKPVGIFALCWIVVKLGIARLSSEISWLQLLGAAWLCGVGFTMAIFIATAAFDDVVLQSVKLSILAASALSAAFGLTLLYVAGRPRPGTQN